MTNYQTGGFIMTAILLAEDEINLQKILTFDLKAAGYDPVICNDGQEVFEQLLLNKFNVYLLDWELPKKSGIEIITEIRKSDPLAHIIMISAKSDEYNKLEAFNTGADDYVTKPYSSRELILRIKAAIKKQEYYNSQMEVEASINKQVLTYKNLTIDLESYTVSEEDRALNLTLKEFELLVYLVRHQGIAISRDNLLMTLWGYDYDGDTRTVDVHIFKLRAKINNKDIKFKTVRGVGYLLEKAS